jgi:hypothetical protein
MMIHFRRDSKGMFRFIFSILFILAIPIILSSLLSCRVSVEGDPHYQGSGPGPGPGPGHSSRIEGQWLFNANNFTGRLEFYWTRNVWTGRMWFDSSGRWLELTDIFLDPRSGQLQFTAVNQQYFGTLSGNQIRGTFSQGGLGGLPWEAWRP